MATVIIKRSDLPDLRRQPEVAFAIRENGQAAVSKLALEQMKGTKYAVVTFDDGNRKLGIQFCDKVPAKMSESDLFPVSSGGKAGGAAFSCSALWQQLGYDYKASGSQIWKEATGLSISEKGMLSITLPEGALPKREVRKRVRKAPGNGTSATAEVKPAENEGEAQSGEGEELEL